MNRSHPGGLISAGSHPGAASIRRRTSEVAYRFAELPGLEDAQRQQIEAAAEDLAGDEPQHAADPGPLDAWARAFDLSSVEVDLLACSLLPELSPQFPRIFRYLQPSLGYFRPSLGVAARAIVGDSADWFDLRARLERGPLWRHGLLRLTDVSAPFFHRMLVPGEVSRSMCDLRLPDELGAGSSLRLRPLSSLRNSRQLSALGHACESVAKPIEHLAQRLGEDARKIAVLCRSESLSPTVVARAVAKHLGKHIVEVELSPSDRNAVIEQARLAALAADAVLLLHLSKDHRASDIEFSGVSASLALPMIVSAASAAQVLPRDGIRHEFIEAPGALVRREFWEATLDEDDCVDTGLLACQRHIGLDVIAPTVAKARSARDGRPLEHRDIVNALSDIIEVPSSTLADVRQPQTRWDEVVIEEEGLERLEGVVRRVRHRAKVTEEWNLGPGHQRPGIAALLHGPPGTGKTLAADALAARLQMPLMAVDLSRIVSKYIGETEKHLASLFEAASGFRAVLFFDEADALFGKRTGISDSHDRYANIGVSYLLQKLEQFEGLTLLTTNILQNIDAAFVRRLDASVRFVKPTAAQRLRIWQLHLPEKVRAPSVDLEHIALKYELVGGEIRNVAVEAAYLAADADTSVRPEHLRRSLRREFIKTGRSIPPELRGDHGQHDHQ